MLNVARPARSNENPFANANCGKRLVEKYCNENLTASRRCGRQSICNPFAVASFSFSSSHSTSSNRTNNQCHCNSVQRMPFNSNNNSKNKNQQKSYRSIHKDYGPFLKYIENHIGIDEESVTLTKNRLGTFSSNNIGGHNNNNYSDHHKMSSTISNPDPLGQLTFSNQSSTAKTKAELDDERHEHLHTNVKNKDLTDKDKIFLLKREIDNLNGQLRGAEKAGYQRSTGIHESSTHVGIFGLWNFVSHKQILGSQDSIHENFGISLVGRKQSYHSSHAQLRVQQQQPQSRNRGI